jgi:hypothetical protein
MSQSNREDSLPSSQAGEAAPRVERALIQGFEPNYFVIWTARYGEPPLQKVHASFDDPGPAARYLEALPARDRPDFSVVDRRGIEVEKIIHRDSWYSHASAIMGDGSSQRWWNGDEDGYRKRGWKFTDARHGALR